MIIQRYLLREISASFLATLFVLLLIIIGNTFVRLLGSVSSGTLPVDALGKLVFLGSINGAIKLAPVALLIGMMLAFGRLYRDHEMTALHASGVGPRQFYKGIFLFVAPLTLLIAVLILFVIPKIEQANDTIKTEIRQRPEAAGIPIGEFMHSTVRDTRYTVFVESLDTDNMVMGGFFLHAEKKNTNNTDTNQPVQATRLISDKKTDRRNIESIESILLAKNALLYISQQSGERILKINTGSRYDIDQSSGEMSIFRFAEHGIHVPALKVMSKRNLGAIPTLTLLKNQDKDSKAEIHWRLALIFSAPVMALLAFPLSYTTPRQGRFSKLALGILLYAIYANLIISGKSMIEDGMLPDWLGLWWVHLAYVLLALWLIRRQYGKIR